MSTVYDVPADDFVKKLAEHLKENVAEVNPPIWSQFSKTGAHRERLPENADWWHIRCASILRKIYMRGPIGVSRLRLYYGGRHGQEHGPEHFRRGGGEIVREAIQQLEKAGLVKTVDKKGRVITKDGRELLNNIAGEVKQDFEKKHSNLKNSG
ncbi:MAG TPA: 30S ribosomal protein S19e [archaeon]|nr:30S ribosomal protein S19e [archaeon]